MTVVIDWSLGKPYYHVFRPFSLIIVSVDPEYSPKQPAEYPNSIEVSSGRSASHSLSSSSHSNLITSVSRKADVPSLTEVSAGRSKRSALRPTATLQLELGVEEVVALVEGGHAADGNRPQGGNPFQLEHAEVREGARADGQRLHRRAVRQQELAVGVLLRGPRVLHLRETVTPDLHRLERGYVGDHQLRHLPEAVVAHAQEHQLRELVQTDPVGHRVIARVARDDDAARVRRQRLQLRHGGHLHRLRERAHAVHQRLRHVYTSATDSAGTLQHGGGGGEARAPLHGLHGGQVYWLGGSERRTDEGGGAWRDEVVPRRDEGSQVLQVYP